MINPEQLVVMVPQQENGSLLVRPTYVAFAEAVGFEPLPIGPDTDIQDLEAVIASSGAILFTGGKDLNPKVYGQPRGPYTEAPDNQRDNIELAAHYLADELGVPKLGICRGAQELFVAEGINQGVADAGRTPLLIQHLEGEASNHNSPTYDEIASNLIPVRVLPGTIAHEIFGKEEIEVACGHHQAMNPDAAPSLSGIQISGVSRDGVIEVVEFRPDTGHFGVGLQSHPEQNRNIGLPVFRRLKQEATRHAARQNHKAKTVIPLRG